jgi:ATP-dependent DNA helicase RecG
MDMNRFETTLAIGETVAVEFKRCGGKAEDDIYETVCSFLNRFGGDIYLGVEDSGKVLGVPPNAARDIVKNFISMVGNPLIISPTVYLDPEILEYNGKKLYAYTSRPVRRFTPSKKSSTTGWMMRM